MVVTHNSKLLDAVSMGSDVTSSLFFIGSANIGSIHITAPSDTHEGSVQVAECNEPEDDPVDVPSLTETVSPGSAVNIIMPFDCASNYIRLKYTRTAGAGALTAKISVKR